MDGHSRNHITHGLLYLAAVGASFSIPFTAHAANITSECSLAASGAATGLSACSTGTGGGYKTSENRVEGRRIGDTAAQAACGVAGSRMCGVQAKGEATAPVYAWGVCKWIDQIGGASDGFFIPFGKKTEEWDAFNAHMPSGLTATGCAVPASQSSLPSTTNIMSNGDHALPRNYEYCNVYNTDTPQVYGRPGISLWPSSPQMIGAPGASTLSCNNGNTTMMAQIQWKAFKAANDPPVANDWTWERKFDYSPDVDITARITLGVTQVTVSWAIAPYVNSDNFTSPISGCVASSAPYAGTWGPDASGMPRSGSTVLNLSSNTNYSFSLRCDGASSHGTALTSVASASLQTGWGGGCSEGCGSGGGWG